MTSHGEAYAFNYALAQDGTSTGLMTQFEYPNGAIKAYTYNDRGRIDSTTSKPAASGALRAEDLP